MIETIAVAGAGTMGSGIAQVAATAGFKTLLFDVNTSVLDNAKILISKNLQSLVDKQKISPEEQSVTWSRLTFISDINACIAGIIIEAIVEKIHIKAALFTQLGALNGPQTIFASNTSSLSISDLQRHIPHPERVAGMHFFNPAPLMKLVEVVSGESTADATATTIYELCKTMGKVPVLCKDAPGFIVNRVARHYYLEAMKLVELNLATLETVDSVMEATGFKMGPFKLMDLIGMDINLAVSQSLYAAFDHAERFRPSAIQEQKVTANELGRKTGKGFYNY